MPDLESKLRAYAVRLDERYPDVTVDELTASPHAERLDQLTGPIDLASVVSAARASTVTLSDAEPPNGTSNGRRLLIAAAAVVFVIGVIGIALATTNNNGQSPAPAATVGVAPTTTVGTRTVLFVVASANDIPVAFTAPEAPDWQMCCTSIQSMSGIGLAHVQFDGVSNIYSDGWAMTLLDPPVGPTVDDLVTAWANVPELNATEPVDIKVNGYHGKQIEFTVPDDPVDCAFDPCRFGVWYGTEPPATSGRDLAAQPLAVFGMPNTHFQMLVLDVHGTRLLIAASTNPDTLPQDRAALEDLLASIQIG